MPPQLEHPAAVLAGGESSGALPVQVYSQLDELPAPYLRLLEETGREDFFLSLPWFRNFAATTLDEGSRLRIYVIGPADTGQPAGLFLARTSSRGGKLFAATNFYSCLFAPHIAGSRGRMRAVLQALTHFIAAERPRWDTFEIQPLDVDVESFSALVEALRAAGFVVQTFFCFGNWHLALNDRSYAEYVKGLTSILRNTLSRKGKNLEKSGRANIQIVGQTLTSDVGLEKAIQDYNKVYLASWKRPEPYAEFIPGLIRMCAGMGALRLGLLYVDGEPAAAQLWIVHNGCALIYKLAYDERFAGLSVGTILTARLMQHVIDVDKVVEVDYLSGDDAYKKDWMSHRRERWGILAMNPRTPRGAWEICRHLGGRNMKRAALWLSRRLLSGSGGGNEAR